MIKLNHITITPITETAAGPVIQNGIPSATPEAVKQIGWLRPYYADEQRETP